MGSELHTAETVLKIKAISFSTTPVRLPKVSIREF